MFCNNQLNVHHIGYAVKDCEHSMNAFIALGFKTQIVNFFDESRNLYISFLFKSDFKIELLSIADKNKPSPIDVILKTNNLCTAYHICYECNDLMQTIKDLETNGFLLINPAQYAPAIGNCNVAFLYHKYMGMIELLEWN